MVFMSFVSIFLMCFHCLKECYFCSLLLHFLKNKNFLWTLIMVFFLWLCLSEIIFFFFSGKGWMAKDRFSSFLSLQLLVLLFVMRKVALRLSKICASAPPTPRSSSLLLSFVPIVLFCTILILLPVLVPQCSTKQA